MVFHKEELIEWWGQRCLNVHSKPLYYLNGAEWMPHNYRCKGLVITPMTSMTSTITGFHPQPTAANYHLRVLPTPVVKGRSNRDDEYHCLTRYICLPKWCGTSNCAVVMRPSKNRLSRTHAGVCAGCGSLPAGLELNRRRTIWREWMPSSIRSTPTWAAFELPHVWWTWNEVSLSNLKNDEHS